MTEDQLKNSFFDPKDFKQLQFLKPAPKHSNDLNTPCVLHCSIISKSVNGTVLQKGMHALHNNLLVFYGDSITGSPQTVLDISFARISVPPANQDPQALALVLTRSGSSFELHFKEQRDMDAWMKALRGVCLLDSFHEDFKAIKMIGRGGFAKVFLVESKLDGNQYAAKAFVKENISVNKKANHKAALINEIEIMKALTHDNIIKLYEVHETEKSIYLVMELIQGKPLQEFLRHLHSNSEENQDSRVTGMAYSILDALAYLSSKGIMHRDLKPANILLDQFGKIKIIDFGLATYVNASNYIFKKCGTPGYIAPEIFNYDSDVPSTFYNDRCDVFSAGCILYYMLFGKPLIIANNASKAMDLNKDFDDIEIIYLVKKEMAKPESKVNKEGLNILLRMLKSNAKSRPSAQELLQHAFFSSVLTKQKSYTPRINVFPDNSPMFRRSSSEYTSTGSLTALQPYKSRYAVKNSFVVDLGNPELNGNLNTISNGSVVNSIAIKREPTSGNPNSMSNFATKDPIKEKFGNQKTKGQSKSFKVQNTGQTFLKAAILKNAQKQNEHENSPKISIFSPQTMKQTRSNSDDVTIEYKNTSSYEEADSSELGEHDDENCHVGSEGLRAFNPKSHTQKKVRRSIRLKFQ